MKHNILPQNATTKIRLQGSALIEPQKKGHEKLGVTREVGGVGQDTPTHSGCALAGHDVTYLQLIAAR